MRTDKQYWEAGLKRNNKIETEDLVVCPYCFEAFILFADEFGNKLDFEEEEQCEECGEMFKVEAEVRYEFWATTKRI